VTPDEAVAALRARLDPGTGRFPGASTTAALLFLLDRARDGDETARDLAFSTLRRTPGDALPSAYAAAAEAAVHVEAVDVARDDGLEKTARAAVDAALRAFGWSRASGGDEDREGTDAHGLMIATLARAAIVLDAPGYREAASRAGEQALDRRVDPSLGTVLHSTGEGSRPAGIADYALLVRGLLELLEASGEKGWLHEAVRLQGEQEERLWDARGGGYFEFPEGAARRSKDGSDGAMVSGNGVAVHNLLELSRLTGERSYRERAGRALAAFAAEMKEEPLRHLTLLHAAQRLQRASSAA
jgi:uncharacterized protein YyaL (SSP411 family)